MTDSILARCEQQGLRMTGPRRIIGEVLDAAEDHPDVEELHRRATAHDPGIALATVYRTVKLFEEQGILERREFGDGRARWEDAERAAQEDAESGAASFTRKGGSTLRSRRKRIPHSSKTEACKRACESVLIGTARYW